MKKALQCILLASLAMVFVVGCDHKKEENKPVQLTPINLNDLSTLKGNYELLYLDMIVNAPGKQYHFISNCDAYLEFRTPNPDRPPECTTANNTNALVQTVFSGDNVNGVFFKVKVQTWGGNISELVSDNPALAKQLSYMYVKPSVLEDAVAEAVSAANNGRSFDTILEVNRTVTEYSLAGINNRIFVTYKVMLPEQPNINVRYTLVLKKINDATPAVDSNVLVNPSAPGFDASGFKSNADISFDPNAPIPPMPQM